MLHFITTTSRLATTPAPPARSHLEHRRLVQRLADDLKAQRQAAAVDARGHRNARQAGEVGGDGEDVVQIHLQRIDLLVAQGEGGRRGGRRQDGVDLVPDGVEIHGDAAADLERADVVGVVESGRQDIGADGQAALDLLAEALGAAGLVEVGQAGRPLGAVAEAHAVVAGQVGRGLGRGDDVIGRQGVFGVRQADLDDLGSRRP